MFSDESFQKSATENALGLIDPATILENNEDAAEELNEARGALDSAIVEAENERDMLIELQAALDILESATPPDQEKILEQQRKIRSQRTHA